MADRAMRPVAGAPSAGQPWRRVAAVLEGVKVAVLALLGGYLFFRRRQGTFADIV